MIVDSPIQSQVIREITRKAGLNLMMKYMRGSKTWGIIQEIMSLKHGDSVSEANYSISVNVNKICISVEDIKLNFLGFHSSMIVLLFN